MPRGKLKPSSRAIARPGSTRKSRPPKPYFPLFLLEPPIGAVFHITGTPVDIPLRTVGENAMMPLTLRVNNNPFKGTTQGAQQQGRAHRT